MKVVENWKPVVGYEGLYEVSDVGRVRRITTGKILKPGKNRYGYLYVNLCKNGVMKTLTVHRLVAFAFVEGRDLFKNEINHVNENKTDNRAINLEWCTAKDNCNHGTRTQRMAETRSIPIIQLTLDYKFVAKWPSSHEAGRNGFDNSNIIQCCKHKHKTAYGFRWLYLPEYEEICYKVYEAQHPFLLALPYRA